MICLTDNDIIKKLAICDLLPETLVALDAQHEDILVLPSAKFSLGIAKNPDRTKSRIGVPVFDRIAEFLGKIREITTPPIPEEQLLFDDVIEIDPGEAILFSATAHFEECLLATGDKRSLRGLMRLPTPNTVATRLAGRVICLEQIIVRIIKRIGFEHVRNKVVPVSDCDTALRAIFGSGIDAVEENVLRGFESYIRHLRGETGSLLASE